MTKKEWPISLCHKFHPEFHLLTAFVPCWPFDGLMCSECGELVTDWGKAKSIAWSALIGWWWEGQVAVKFDEVEK